MTWVSEVIKLWASLQQARAVFSTLRPGTAGSRLCRGCLDVLHLEVLPLSPETRAVPSFRTDESVLRTERRWQHGGESTALKSLRHRCALPGLKDENGNCIGF